VAKAGYNPFICLIAASGIALNSVCTIRLGRNQRFSK